MRTSVCLRALSLATTLLFNQNARAENAERGSLWVTLSATYVQRDATQRDFGAMVLLGLPLERWNAKRRAPIAEQDEAPEPPPVLVSPSLARGAVEAAASRAKLSNLDLLASRARTAALLPELTLRVTRLVNEGQELSPTEYDPTRITASGGTSLSLEARATWRLDKLVFAGDEVAFERMRETRAEARAKLTDRILKLLFAWQRATVAQADPKATPEEQLRASLEAAEAEAELEVLTGGFLARFRALKRL